MNTTAYSLQQRAERAFYLQMAKEAYRTARALDRKGECFKALTYRMKAADARCWANNCKLEASSSRVVW